MGREQELAVLKSCIEEAVGGTPSVVVVQGAAGIGKSSLVWSALRQHSAMTVLRASCDEAEADFAFGMVTQLCTHIPEELKKDHDVLREPVIPPATASYVVGAQLVELLGQLQEGEPVAVVVDDVQWADTPSVHALGFVLRRLWADQVLIILTARTGGGDESAPEWERLMAGPQEARVIDLRGLGEGEVTELAANAGLDERAARRLFSHTEGHPLYVRTLLRDYAASDFAGHETPLPVPSNLADAVRHQTAVLPADSLALLQALAVLGGTHPLAMVASLAGVADGSEALEPLLSAGLVLWSPSQLAGPVRMHHALQQEAIYHGILPGRRTQLHRQAATLVDAATAWRHRVAAADTTDNGLAQELETEAGRSLAEGSAAAAVTYLLWACHLSDTREERERRLLQAGLHLAWSGQFDRLGTLVTQIAACDPSRLRDVLTDGWALNVGDGSKERHLARTTREAACAPDGGEWAAAAAGGCFLGLYYFGSDRIEEALELTNHLIERIVDRLPPDFAQYYHVSLLYFLSYTAGPSIALAEFNEKFHLPSRAQDVGKEFAHLLGGRGVVRAYAGHFRDSLIDVTTALRGGSQHNIPTEEIHSTLALSQYFLGDWDDALISAEHCLTITEVQHQHWYLPIAYMLAVLPRAGRGQWDSAQGHLQSLRDCTDDAGREVGVAIAEASLAHAAGDSQKLLEATQFLVERALKPSRARALHLLWEPWHAEALIESNRLDEAIEAVAQVRRTAHDSPCLATAASWLAARLTWAQGDIDQALQRFQEDAPKASADDIPLHRAHQAHAHGRLHLSRNDRRQAVTHLRTAHHIYSTLSALPYLERCTADLERCGLNAPSDAPHSLLALNERETAIAHLVVQGMTNQEAANHLFVSTKTIEYHLSRIYSKLGISSRRDLRAHVHI
ncbi:helix-turn-helix transcriptional regulator [Streptomyces virginiae]|uniref:helix-turn-helix transcriptional regulator n=1 Tax=Streptomyces virginiae TaxID=1961 RepID=UPI0024AF7CF8|nr:AAA family ATPase [Streptomyces virginiae]